VPDDDPASFLGQPSNTREAVLRATHEVLCERGYGGVSMSRIADRAGVSTSVLYHHYDDKDGLMRELFDATLAAFVAETMRAEASDGDRLTHPVEVALSAPFPGDVAGSASVATAAFVGTYVELRARASHDARYRERVTEAEALLGRELATAHDGRERRGNGTDVSTNGNRGVTGAGTDPDVDTERTVEWLVTVVQGLVFQRVTTDGVDLDAVRAELDRHLDLGLEPGGRTGSGSEGRSGLDDTGE
jgi:AcrR family transcriptional regulator